MNPLTGIAQSGILEILVDYVRRLGRGGSGYWGVTFELLLIGVIVYVALKFLWGTRGARLLKSVGIILLTSFIVVRVVAERLELERIVFLYPYFFGGVVLTALVAFQPEIRRGLIQLGGTRWIRLWSKEESPVIDPVVDAAAHLSQKKIGALIAIQRDVGLDALAESGVRVDAEITTELLETIFWPGTVLHDLGVIIRNARLWAAACQFPMAESGDLLLSLGSRHRAALGLSQECDAVIVVVSEETGTISVAVNGTLHRHLTPSALRELLEYYLLGGESEQDRPKSRKDKDADHKARKPDKRDASGKSDATAAATADGKSAPDEQRETVHAS